MPSTEKSPPDTEIQTVEDMSKKVNQHFDVIKYLNDHPTSVSRSLNKVVLLLSLFVDCLESLLDAMDQEWKDVISFDEDIEAIPLGHGTFQQFVAFATFDATSLRVDPPE